MLQFSLSQKTFQYLGVENSEGKFRSDFESEVRFEKLEKILCKCEKSMQNQSAAELEVARFRRRTRRNSTTNVISRFPLMDRYKRSQSDQS